MQLDSIDKSLLDLLQNGFPLEAEPYRKIGSELGLSEDEAIAKTKALYKQNVIRFIGPIIDVKSLGFASALVAFQVPEKNLEQAANLINAYPGVSHNYQRNHQYSLWYAKR